MKKKKLKILTILAIPLIFIVFCVSWFWYSQTHTGSRSGQVFDANSGKPIEGAVVNYTWTVSGFLENAIGGGGPTVSYETLTDKNGKYYIPNLRVKRTNILQWTLEPEEVLVYKDKYAVYKLYRQYKKPPEGRSFGYPRKNQPYRKKNNIVKLFPFKEGESHYDHVKFIGIQSAERDKLLLKEIQKEEERAHEENLKKWGQK
jgi:hypothetical protein